jgi:hypothetical protein
MGEIQESRIGRGLHPTQPQGSRVPFNKASRNPHRLDDHSWHAGIGRLRNRDHIIYR